MACAWNNRGMTKKALPRGDLQQALGHAASDKRLEVLRRVGESGSISQAARDAGISYKAAWQAIDTLSSLGGVALVERTVGGSGGGGARLTVEGERLLRLADELAQARAAVLARFAGPGEAARGPDHGLGLRTSMRNQMPCRVADARPATGGDPLVRVTLAPDSGQPMVSAITQDSADLLGLAPGLPVLVLCKATAVRVAAEAPAPQDGVSNLSGKVWRVTRGQQRDEVTLALPGGVFWVGFAERPFARRKGQTAHASMASSALVIALPH